MIRIGAVGLLFAAASLSTADEKTIEARGFVVPARRVSLSSSVAGRIVSVMVKEGQTVKQGEVIARLDSVALELDLKRALLRMEAAKVSLVQIERGAAKVEQKETVIADIKKAEASLKLAEAQYDRILQAVRQGVAAKEDLVRTQAALDEAKAVLEKHKAMLKIAEAGPPRDEIDLAKIRIELAKVEVEKAKVAVDECVVRAPFEGIVHKLNAEPGAYTNPAMQGLATGASLCDLVDVASPQVETALEQVHFSKLKPGMACEIAVAALDGKPIPGIIESISPVVERGRVAVRIGLKPGKETIPIGASVGIKIATKD